MSGYSEGLGASEAQHIRAFLLLCFSLLGFFFPKTFIFLTCGHLRKFKKDVSHPGLLFFRGPVIFFSFNCFQYQSAAQNRC